MTGSDEPKMETTYLGLRLRSPLVASASPLTGDIDELVALEAAGAAAVVLPSLFEEQLAESSMAPHDLLQTGADHPDVVKGFFPDLVDYNAGPERYLYLVEAARAKLSIPVIASLNGVTPGGWLRYAVLLEQAGASALELNLYDVVSLPTAEPSEVEDRYVEIVDVVANAVGIPVAVKLSPFFTALPHTARRFAAAGAKGLVLFNRFYQPDIDLEDLAVVPRLELSSPADLRLPMRWIALLREQIAISLAGSGGVHSPGDAVKLLLVGADVVMMTSALLVNGVGFLSVINNGVRDWMAERGYESVDELRGSLRRRDASADLGYERAAYVRTLSTALRVRR